ncbi:hypothetical protein N7532_011391 [Penicillium argentinense]|uniref:Uncharacterized protein n=1 Tax=Penicillium argentinense TaxID=1131581 RepID=A0A9W9JUS7_9EURO|nr:uncharacterized protein N7532_011391 [Penicillium argentinense]KAJ5082348.1 hypothetical protein N7532_011391 [Penicillium argentinense]
MAPWDTTMSATTSLLKRDSGSSRFSLYVFVIIVGCVAVVLIGFGIWTMYHGLDDENNHDIPFEQRKYMREVRQRNINGLAVAARRPDMIIPVEELNH